MKTTDTYSQVIEKTTGARREDFGKLCVAMRDNALRNPHALMKKPLSLDDYMAARELLWRLQARGIGWKVYTVSRQSPRLHARGKPRVVFRPYEWLTEADTAALREYWPFVEYLIVNGDV